MTQTIVALPFRKICRISFSAAIIIGLATGLLGCQVSTFDQGGSSSGNQTKIMIAIDYNVSQLKFTHAYKHDADVAHYHRKSFPIPSLWLYSSDGKLVALATDDHSLKELLDSFPPEGSPELIPNAPDFSALMKTYTEAGGGSAPQRSTDKFNAVLFFTNAPKCEECTPFVHGLHDLVQKHRSRVNGTSILLMY